MVSMTWLSSNCRILPIRLGRLPPRTSAFFACASHVSRKSLSGFLPRDDRRLQPWLLLLGRGGCSLGSDCVERAGHGPAPIVVLRALMVRRAQIQFRSLRHRHFAELRIGNEAVAIGHLHLWQRLLVELAVRRQN